MLEDNDDLFVWLRISLYYMKRGISLHIPVTVLLLGMILCSANAICVNNSFAANASGTCLLCSVLMPNCNTCSNSSTCSQCATNYILNLSRVPSCLACATAFPHCSLCSTNSCLSCSPSYIMNLSAISPSLTCLSCGTGCASCTNLTVCLSCINSYGMNSTIMRCSPCSAFMTNCATCNSSDTICLTCISTAFFEPNLTCSLCNIYMPNCISCSSSSLCARCDLYNAFDSSGACISCSNFMSACTACNSLNTSCLACSTDVIAVDTSVSPNQCRPCNVWLSYCTNCISSSRCIRCIADPTIYLRVVGTLRSATAGGGYYTYNRMNGSYGICTLCNVSYSYCVTCDISRCISCIANTSIALVNNLVCKLCSEIMTYCVTCSSQSFCLQCLSNSYSLIPINSTHRSCGVCNQIMAGCLLCTDEITCLVCSMGKPTIGGCSLIPGCALVGQIGLGKSICVACDPLEYYGGLINGSCVCLKGHLAGWYCTDIIGCLTANRDLGGQYCLACNNAGHFRLANKTCSCIDHYHIVNEACVQICGDGRLFQLSCDDGNLVSGDGCSSNCLIEPGYTCQRGSSTSPSQCTYQGKISFVLESITAVKDANQVVITFRVEPATGAVTKLNMDSCLTFTTDAASSLNKTEVSAEKVKLYLDFFQSLSNNPASLKIEFDPQYIRSPPMSLKFGLEATDGSSFIFDPEIGSNSQSSTSEAAREYLAYAAVATFFIGTLGYKMVGVETIHVFQQIAIAQVFSRRYHTYFHHFQSLLIPLGRSPFVASSNPSPHSQMADLNYSDNFQADYFLIGIILLVLSVIYLGMFLRQKIKGGSKLSTKIYDYGIFPITAGFYYNLMLSLLNESFAPAGRSSNHKIQNGVLLLGAIIVSGLVFSRDSLILFLSPPKQIDYKKYNYQRLTVEVSPLQAYECSRYYTALYLNFQFCWILLISLTILEKLPYPLEICGAFSFLRFIICLSSKPYTSIVHRVGFVINNLSIMFSYSWLIWEQLENVSTGYRQMLALGLMAILILVLAMSLVRTAYCLRQRFRGIIVSLSKKQVDSKMEEMQWKGYKRKDSLIPLHGWEEQQTLQEKEKKRFGSLRKKYREIIAQLNLNKNSEAGLI